MTSNTSLVEFIEEQKLVSRKVIYCVLNWGLGHASRSVRFIEELIKHDNDVVIASDGAAAKFLLNRFPNLEHRKLASTSIKYSKKPRFFAIKMIAQLPSFIAQVRKEHRELEKLVKDEKTSVVISDNRYGCYSSKCESYFLCHQLNIKSPVFQKLAQVIHEYFIKKFKAVLIPDFSGEKSLAGDLSLPLELPVAQIYIGPLSRFSKRLSMEEKPTYEAIAIISGPEPSRSIFEKELIDRFGAQKNYSFVIVQGLMAKNEHSNLPANIELHHHLDDEALLKLMAKSRLVISRSGYSSLMDYYQLGINAELHPTPGQPEQEYLAKRWSGKELIKQASLQGSPNTI